MTILFCLLAFVFGLIAGGCVAATCNEGAMGPAGPPGPPGLQGERGESGVVATCNLAHRQRVLEQRVRRLEKLLGIFSHE